MPATLLRQGRILNPATHHDAIGDVVIEGEKIVALAPSISPKEGWSIIDASGLCVTPGWIDMHVHFREPGDPDSETLLSGSRAAAAGGFTSVVCMANTDPVHDNALLTRALRDAARDCPIHVYFMGAVTRGLRGEELADLPSMHEAGVIAFSDDGASLQNGGLLREALRITKMLNCPLIVHAEDTALKAKGVLHEGPVAWKLGLPGNPAVAEWVSVARDILLAQDTEAHLHFAHLSCAQSVAMVREAKAKKIRVTAEASPHHLILSQDDMVGYDTRFKVAPPLRTPNDNKALVEGLRDGTIDALATDHAPHCKVKKEVLFEEAAFGISGLESAMPIYASVAQNHNVPLLSIVRAVTLNPADILGLNDKGRLAIGGDADIALFDLQREWKVEAPQWNSQSTNTPFWGRTLTGKAVATFVHGKLVYQDSSWRKRIAKQENT